MVQCELGAKLSTLNLCHVGSLVYPILLACEAGEISKAKAAELLNMNQEELSEIRDRAVKSIVDLTLDLPSPLAVLLSHVR